MSKRSKKIRRWSPFPIRPFFVAVLAYTVACLIFGGGSREGFVADAALQGLAVPLLLIASWRLIDVPSADGGGRGRALLAGCALIALFPLAQMVPLPPSIWSLLPERSDFESNLLAAGLDIGWLPLSVAPSMTWLSALALLPPFAIFLSVLQFDYVERRRLSLAMLLVGMVSVGLGLLQVAQGTTSALRFYEYTNTTEAVGFFANRNHYSALLYCLVLIATAFAVASIADFARTGLSLKSTRSTPYMIAVLASFAAVVILVAAQAMARSRAGLGLTVVALIGALALGYLAPLGTTKSRENKDFGPAARGAIRLLVAAIALAALLGTQFALYRVLHRFDFDAMADVRWPYARNTIEAAVAYMPFGSGMGTFVFAYVPFEKLTDNAERIFANRAHNDFLELWLEAGLAGLILMVVFVIWTFLALWRVWRRGLPGAGHSDNLLACAAALALVLLLAHSTVDYPLRTTAMMGVFAWAVAMVVPPVGSPIAPPSEQPVRSRGSTRRRQRQTDMSSAPGVEAEGVPTSGPSDAPPPGRFAPAPPRDDWPESWRTPEKSGPPEE